MGALFLRGCSFGATHTDVSETHLISGLQPQNAASQFSKSSHPRQAKHKNNVFWNIGVCRFKLHVLHFCDTSRSKMHVFLMMCWTCSIHRKYIISIGQITLTSNALDIALHWIASHKFAGKNALETFISGIQENECPPPPWATCQYRHIAKFSYMAIFIYGDLLTTGAVGEGVRGGGYFLAPRQSVAPRQIWKMCFFLIM